MKQTLFSDHRGKTSSGRVASLAGTATACAMLLAPIFGGPDPDMWAVAMAFGIPGGFSLWQKNTVPAEKPPKDD